MTREDRIGHRPLSRERRSGVRRRPCARARSCQLLTPSRSRIRRRVRTRRVFPSMHAAHCSLCPLRDRARRVSTGVERRRPHRSLVARDACGWTEAKDRKPRADADRERADGRGHASHRSDPAIARRRARRAACGPARLERHPRSRAARLRAPIVVPCRRVIAADGRLGGFSAPGGTTKKQRLLAIEKARPDRPPGLFDDDAAVSPLAEASPAAIPRPPAR